MNELEYYWIKKLMQTQGSNLRVSRISGRGFSASICFYEHPELNFRALYGDVEESIIKALLSLDRAIQDDCADDMVKAGAV